MKDHQLWNACVYIKVSNIHIMLKRLKVGKLIKYEKYKDINI